MDEIRLINAEELKTDLKQYFSDGTLESVSAKLAFNMILRKIDNAPTVEAVEFEYHSKLIKQAYQKGKDIRPQGEWENDSDNLPICNKCGEIALQRIFVKMPHLIQDVRMVRSNYCPNCGADMQIKKKIQTPSCLTNPERQAELLERYKEE